MDEATMPGGGILSRGANESEEQFSIRVARTRSRILEDRKSLEDRAASDALDKARRVFGGELPQVGHDIPEEAIPHMGRLAGAEPKPEPEPERPEQPEPDKLGGLPPSEPDDEPEDVTARDCVFMQLNRSNDALRRVRDVRYDGEPEAIVASNAAVAFALLDVADAIRAHPQPTPPLPLPEVVVEQLRDGR